MSSQPAARQDTVAALRQALANYEQRGEAGVDWEGEKRKAQVRERALILLDQRSRSRHELVTRLCAADYPASVVEEVVADLAAVGLVNDEHFAKEWVRQRHSRRGKSRQALNQELKAKGVPDGPRHEALATVDSAQEEETARHWAAKKARTVAEAPADYREYQKILRRVVGVLQRRGFDAEMSLRISRQELDSHIAQLSS